MALPKRKTSKARRDKRRTHYWKVAVPPLVKCRSCGELILPHSACPFCGFYQGIMVLKVKKKKEEEEAAAARRK